MNYKMNENNKVYITGKIDSEFTYDHTVRGESFYKVFVSINRFSGYVDRIPVLVSERLTNVKKNAIGSTVKILGQYRSFSQYDEKKDGLKMFLFVFAKDWELLSPGVEIIDNQEIFLDGYVCRPTAYRTTLSGRRVTDVFLAVNRFYKKSDYIPCICWERNAIFASGFEVGDHVQIKGRIQSREYVKKLSSDTSEKRIAYEVSISELTYIGKRSDEVAN